MHDRSFLWLLAAVFAGYAIRNCTGQTLSIPGAQQFAFNGYQPQTYSVPNGTHYLKIDACGGGGRVGDPDHNIAAESGPPFGGYISAVVPVAPLQNLYVYVGSSSESTGYNGGGIVNAYSNCNGAGGTDIRTVNGGNDGSKNVTSRLVVAGGRGGGVYGGGAGGGPVGGNTPCGPPNQDTTCAFGGSQTAGGLGMANGTLWAGSPCLQSPCSFCGGGGGYFGGAGGYPGGGGSSFAVASGTILENVQGDPRCNGNGVLYITPVTSMAPSPAPTATDSSATSLAVPGAIKFDYTNGPQTFTVPAGVSLIKVDACGGSGSGLTATSGGPSQVGYGGLGGFLSALVPVTPGSTLFVYVGGGTGFRSSANTAYNGGGCGLGCISPTQVESSGGDGGGGGGTDLRTQSGGESGNANPSSRLFVAGGGGGGGGGGSGGDGGGLIGGSGSSSSPSPSLSCGYGSIGCGGSQTNGGSSNNCGIGSIWQGGKSCDNGYDEGDGSEGGGGGGGYYGGGAGMYGAGGGSSFVIPAGTILENVQGDPRCAGNGVLFITIGATPRPSPMPTPTPTAQPTAPTPVPTYFLLPGAASFSFTGGPQQYSVPAGVSFIKVDACGAAAGEYGNWGMGAPSFGGFISGVIPVAPLTRLFVYVGGNSGFNGGGAGTYFGGGGTDLRTADGGASGSQNVGSRLVVAGGGGGGAGTGSGVGESTGGLGGGQVGGSGTVPQPSSSGLCLPSTGGSQSAGGSGGPGYSSCSPSSLWAGGSCPSVNGYGIYNGNGGGGGYYGGGANQCSGGGGGGSSYLVASGTILENVQGDPRCNGNGVLYITPVTSMAPSPAPTAPTPVPTFSSFHSETLTAFADLPDPVPKTLYLPTVRFTNLGSEASYFLDISFAATGWASNRQVYAIVRVNNISALTFSCMPQDDCGSPSLESCMTNVEIQPSQLISRNSGSIEVTTVIIGAQLAAPRCLFRNYYYYASFTIQGSHRIPTPSPTAAPSAPIPRPTGVTASATASENNRESLDAVVTTTGALFYIIAAVAGVYAAFALLLAQVKQQFPQIHQLGLLESTVTMALVGSSFASEMFLASAMLHASATVFTALGVVVLLGRLLHLPVTGLLLFKMFSWGSRQKLDFFLHSDLIFANAKVFGALAFLGATDSTVLRYFPWLSSPFSRKSDYPDSFVFRACVITKLVQSLITVSCQVSYFIMVNAFVTANTVQAQHSLAFLIVNLTTTLLLVVINAFEYFMKRGILLGGSLSTAPDGTSLSAPPAAAAQPALPPPRRPSGTPSVLQRLSLAARDSLRDFIPPAKQPAGGETMNPLQEPNDVEMVAKRMKLLEEQNAQVLQTNAQLVEQMNRMMALIQANGAAATPAKAENIETP